MNLNVKARGESVATFRWICVRSMEMLAAWVPTTPEMEVKLVFGTSIWYMAQHADNFGKRTHELRLPPQHSQTPTDGYVRFLSDLAATAKTDRRVAGFFDCLLPALERRYSDYLTRVDPLLDGPTVQILERIKFDLSKMGAEGRSLLAEVPAVGLGDTAWLEKQRQLEASIENVVHHAPVQTAGAA